MMAFIRVIALALALAGCSARSSHPSESARNQYEAGEDRPQPQLLTEATDHPPEVHMSHQPDFIKKSTNSSKQLTAPDLQVGCGDGFIHEKLQANSEVDKNKLLKKRLRKKRSYTPLSGRVIYSVPYQSISVWRPPVYQLSRPYYIPVYGVPGRIPIYYPPQPLYVNPGVPKDNPVKKPFQGPTYLPPVESTTMTIGNRFNGGDNNDDRPVWDTNDNQLPVGSTQRPTTEVVPTRRTRPPGVPKIPPLVHNPTDPEEGSNNQVQSGSDGFATPEPLPAVVPQRPGTTRRPSTGPNEPTRCVWAIISCCSSSQISYDCFEQRGCPGPFWDSSPCDSDFAKAAIAAALNYYNK